MTVSWRTLTGVLLLFCSSVGSAEGQSKAMDERTDILSQLRAQELQERSAASRAKQVQYELQVAQAKHAINRLQQPQAITEKGLAMNQPTSAVVALIGWTQQQGKVRFLLRVNERIVRVWDGIRDQSGLLATRVNNRVQVSLGEQTYQLEIADAQPD